MGAGGGEVGHLGALVGFGKLLCPSVKASSAPCAGKECMHISNRAVPVSPDSPQSFRRNAPFKGVLSMAVLAGALAVSPVWAGPGAIEADGKLYPVNQFLVDFAEDLPVHPPVVQLLKLEVELGDAEKGYVSPREGVPTIKVRLVDVPALPKHAFYGSAIRAINKAVVDYFKDWGYTGIKSEPHAQDISTDTLADERPQGQTALRLVIGSIAGRGTPKKMRGPVWDDADDRDGKPFRISQVIFEPREGLKVQPNVADLLKLEVMLGETDSGYIAPRTGVKTVQIRFADIPKLGNPTFFTSALQAMSDRVEQYYQDQGDPNASARPDPRDVNAAGNDTRFQNQTAMRMAVSATALEPLPLPQIAQAPAPAPAAPPTDLPKAGEDDGDRYPVSQIIVEYGKDHPNLPPLDQIMQTTVQLSPVQDGFTAAKPGAPVQTVRLVDLPTTGQPYLYGSAIRLVNQRLVEAFNERGYIGIYIAPNPQDISDEAQDIRPEGQTAMRLQVRVGQVTEVRTLASGDRVPTEERIDSPQHERILAHSPVKPGDAQDLLRKDLLDDYIYRLNRHPGRRVDVAVSAAEGVGGVALDFLVTEAKPWMVYAQVSNTGTKETNNWRERFGFSHSQLTGRDDILNLDYVTAGFESAHTFQGSYEAPFFESERLRWRVFGSWSQFTAADVGFAGEDFTGEEWQAGGEMIYNIYQRREHFIDAIVGTRWQSVHVNNEIIDVNATEDFFLPYVGLKYERITETATTLGSVTFTANIPSVAGTSSSEIANLGRPFVDDDMYYLSWDLSQSFYLEPLLNRAAWEDTSTPASSTLAHEVFLGVRGQYAFGKRLIPQHEQTVGGLYTVRGYPESVQAGDTVVIGNVEYRLHIPRLFAIRPEPGTLFGQTFRWAPQQVYGRPDWDLLMRAFFDVGRVMYSERRNYENEQTLMGTGLGVELVYKRNFSVRVDWAVALEGIENQVTSGSDRFHILATFLY